jgi:hypothetical protein
MPLAAVSVLPLWASIVLAVASPLVAVVALIVGKQQQDKTLEHEGERQTATLEQERERQTRLLRHERQRDDLREVRSVLDDAARALHEADHRRRDMIRDLDNETKREALRRAGVVLDELKERIAIRFGREHEVTKTFAACADAMLEVFGATQFADLFELSDLVERMNAAGEKFERLQPDFVDAATAHAGVELVARA